jgi:hypothetical protein
MMLHIDPNNSNHINSNNNNNSSSSGSNNNNHSSALNKLLVPNVSLENFGKTPSNLLFPIQNRTVASENSPMDRYRLQFFNYDMIERMKNQAATDLQQFYEPFNGYSSRLAFSIFQNRVFQSDEPKPQHSYIGNDCSYNISLLFCVCKILE